MGSVTCTAQSKHINRRGNLGVGGWGGGGEGLGEDGGVGMC